MMLTPQFYLLIVIDQPEPRTTPDLPVRPLTVRVFKTHDTRANQEMSGDSPTVKDIVPIPRVSAGIQTGEADMGVDSEAQPHSVIDAEALISADILNCRQSDTSADRISAALATKALFDHPIVGTEIV